MWVVVLLAMMAGAILSGGCATPSASLNTEKNTGNTSANSADAPALTYPASRRAEVFAGVTVALRDAGYALDRADYRAGVITTKPRAVATALEPWSGAAGSNGGGDLAWAATLGHLRRVVRVTAERAKTAADTEQIRVSVQLLRYAAPQRRVINAARGRMFSMLAAVPQPWADRGIRGVYWHPIGHDSDEEARLLAALIAATATAD